MPVYSYKCLACGSPDLRIADVDDDTAACHLCGGQMIRQSRDSRNALRQYFSDLSFRPLARTDG